MNVNSNKKDSKMVETMTKTVTLKLDLAKIEKYSNNARQAVETISERAGKSGQFLNWINVLPENQIKNIDNLFDMAEKARNNKYTDLAILGIGGSRHTTESLMKMIGRDSNVHFYSSVDSESFRRFINSLDLAKTQFLVVSKSGGTLETTTAYESAKKLMQEHTGKEDVSDRFIAMTDVSSEKSQLRRAVDRGDIKLSGLVHDDVGGRFSIFDDATLFTMAYAGVSKEDTVKMLKASLKAQDEFLNPNIKENEALQLAAVNVDSKNAGKSKHYVEYFSDGFSGITLWDKQLNNESLKAQISTETNIGPGYLHYNAEADLDEANTDSYYTFVYPTPADKTTNAVIKGVTTAYKAQHPVVEIEMKDFSPESIARFIELKHFETLYTGNMLRRAKGNITDKSSALPEVLQPNVEKYKKEVKANL
jgi:transaldolase/glucose-6-phosphate isomerase